MISIIRRSETLINWTAQPLSPAFRLMGTALIGLATVLTLTDHSGEVVS